METRRHLGLCRTLVCGLLLVSRSAYADSVEFNVSTLLAGRADPRDGEIHTVVPVYQSLGVTAQIKRPYFDSINIVMSGWGSVQLDIGRDLEWLEERAIRHGALQSCGFELLGQMIRRLIQLGRAQAPALEGGRR